MVWSASSRPFMSSILSFPSAILVGDRDLHGDWQVPYGVSVRRDGIQGGDLNLAWDKPWIWVWVWGMDMGSSTAGELFACQWLH